MSTHSIPLGHLLLEALKGLRDSFSQPPGFVPFLSPRVEIIPPGFVLDRRQFFQNRPVRADDDVIQQITTSLVSSREEESRYGSVILTHELSVSSIEQRLPGYRNFPVTIDHALWLIGRQMSKVSRCAAQDCDSIFLVEVSGELYSLTFEYQPLERMSYLQLLPFTGKERWVAGCQIIYPMEAAG